MTLMPPANEKIRAAFPVITNLQEMARGGYKVVFKAEMGAKREVFKLVCLAKVGKSDEEKQAYRRESLGRIRREVELLGQCHCQELVKLGSIQPNLATIDGTEYVGYSEELLDGENLWDILRRRGEKPTEGESKRLFLSLLRAIDELWTQHRTIHRDIKPHNVIKLNNSDRPFVLLDLGIAYGLQDTALTRDSGLLPCTPRYLDPEMAKPDFRRTLDFRSDIYTAGLTVFEYSAQFHPLAKTRDDLISTISRAIHQTPRPMQSVRPDFTGEFCALIDQTLKKKRILRPSNLAALIAKMEEC